MDLNDKIWNPWHGCQNCYIYFLDKRYGRDTNEVVKNKSDFTLPVKKDRNGNWKLPGGSFVRVCMARAISFWRKPTHGASRPGI